MVYNIEFYPTYLKYEYYFFFISISGRIRNIFPAEPDPIRGKRCRILIPDLFSKPSSFLYICTDYFVQDKVIKIKIHGIIKYNCGLFYAKLSKNWGTSIEFKSVKSRFLYAD